LNGLLEQVLDHLEHFRQDLFELLNLVAARARRAGEIE